MTDPPFPRILRVKQHFPVSPPVDIPAVLSQGFERIQRHIKPGARIAVAVGSRGITNLQSIVAGVLDLLRAAGAHPFIIPAMGSHGGATPEGQKEILAEYGITESQLQVPIQAAMEVERLGATDDGVEALISVEALRADGIVVVNRIKPHTDFSSDSLGSGLLKMLVVGLGKHQGAANYHVAVTRLNHEHVTRSLARLVLRSVPVLCGVAIVENQTHDTARLDVLTPDEFERREAELFAEAKRTMPRLPFDDIDLLIVDRIGKNISGTGMDPNVIGRDIHGYSTRLEGGPQTVPVIRRLFVRDLTPETHGNAIGIGLADFTTTRLVRAMDLQKTYMNVLTSLSLNSVKIPIHFETDREVIAHGLATLAMPDSRQARVVRVADTLSLARQEVSEAFAEVIRQTACLEVLSSAAEIQFGPDGNLLPLDW